MEKNNRGKSERKDFIVVLDQAHTRELQARAPEVVKKFPILPETNEVVLSTRWLLSPKARHLTLSDFLDLIPSLDLQMRQSDILQIVKLIVTNYHELETSGTEPALASDYQELRPFLNSELMFRTLDYMVIVSAIQLLVIFLARSNFDDPVYQKVDALLDQVVKNIFRIEVLSLIQKIFEIMDQPGSKE